MENNRGESFLLNSSIIECYNWIGIDAFDKYKWSGFILANDRWGGGNGRIWFKEQEKTWAFWTEHTDDMLDGKVKSFPHAGIGWYWGDWASDYILPVRLGDLTVAKADWSVTLPEKADNQSYVIYLQLYTSDIPDPGRDPSKVRGDLAIILYRKDFPFEDWGIIKGEFEVSGSIMRLIHKRPAIGQSTYVIMVPVPDMERDGNKFCIKGFDIKSCIDTCVSCGFYDRDGYLLTIQAGWEVRALHGIIKSNDLSFTVGRKGMDPFSFPQKK